MQDMHLSYEDVSLYLIVFNVLLGLLFGTFPLLAALRLKVAKLGWLGFFGSIVGGALAGFFLAFPFSLLMTWLIIRRSQAAPSINVDIDLSGENDHTA